MILPADDRSLKVDSVTVRFGELAALDCVSLNVAAGERVGLVGPSGAGKTTLLRLFNGSVRPTTGKALVLGHDVSQLRADELRRLRSRVGFVHQDFSLVPNARVIRNVLAGRLGRQSLAGSLRSMLFPTRAEAVDAHRILERVGVQEKLYERTDRLSGGQRQRVAIARRCTRHRRRCSPTSRSPASTRRARETRSRCSRRSPARAA